MKATQTVAQSSRARKSADVDSRRKPASIHFRRLFESSHGVVVLVGYGIQVRVEKGHLILEDGIGDDRRAGRFPRVHHNLRRVVVIGGDGMVSFGALQWLADQKIAFVMLERDGSVLVSTGPVAASDTRLRRAQACAAHSPAAIEIVRELIRRKISGQEQVAKAKLSNAGAANAIARFGQQLETAESIDAVRMLEGHAAGVYWTAWQAVPVQFPTPDLARVPEHWRTFGTRRSPISGTSRRPPNPVNAILNYLYTLLESETRLAITALGLDPGFGLLHVDQSTRDSLVYDLMEPIRPSIDAYVLDWITRTPLKRSWFFEERDGCCRLMAELTVKLSDTAETWSREIAPIVEWFAQRLSSDEFQKSNIRVPGTRLTQRRHYESAGGTVPVPKDAPRQHSVCLGCGLSVSSGVRHCVECARSEALNRLETARKIGRDAAQTPQALTKRAQAVKRQCEALRKWRSSDVPDWLDDAYYTTKVQPELNRLSKPEIASALAISERFAYKIAHGEKIPHRRHWLKLAGLVRIVPGG